MAGSSGAERMPEAATTERGCERLIRLGSHHPRRVLLVEGHRDDLGMELDVAAKVKPVGDEVQIGLDLRLGRHRLRPNPFLLNLFREAVRVLDALDVTTRTGIAVVQPSPADVFGHFQHAGPQSELPQPMQRIQTGEARADDQHVERRDLLQSPSSPLIFKMVRVRCRVLIRQVPSCFSYVSR